MVTVVGDELPRLSACLDDARALLELMPDTVDLHVEKFGWCAHGELSVVSRSVPISFAPCSRRKLVPELGDEALGRPRAGFAKGTNRPSGDIVGHTFQRVGVLLGATPMKHSLGDFFHPERAFPTG